MRTIIIVQARMGSTRLPGKVLEDIAGRTMLARTVERARKSSLADEVIVATTSKPIDQLIVEECGRLFAPFFRGSEDDVLDRYYHAARLFHADVVVRVTCDCPLVDPEEIDHVISVLLGEKADFASNALQRTYPHGLDTEVMTMAALSRTWEEAQSPYEWEHVTPYLYEHPAIFNVASVTSEKDYSAYRLTVDTEEDLILIRTVYDRLGADGDFLWRDVLRLLEREPELMEINRHVRQKRRSEDKQCPGNARCSLRGVSIVLTGVSVSLKTLGLEHATEKYAGWLNDPSVNRYLETRSVTVLKLRQYIREKLHSDSAVLFGIFWKGSDKHIGTVKLEPVDFDLGVATMGILIGDRTYWGRGIAVEATNLVVDFAFSTLGMREVRLGVIAENTSALRVFEKCGFIIDRMEKRGVNHDGVFYDTISMKKMNAHVVTGQTTGVNA